MLTQEENDLLTRVGPGTPCGDLLRRYWHPLCAAADLTPERPRQRVEILGEPLVVFRLPDGRHGLLAEHCAHRGASLAYGFVEDDGLRCAYHGWKHAPDGRCLEQPFEPPGSRYKDRVCQRAYRVRQWRGLLWAYLGPEPAPLLPRWDVLARQDGTHHVEVHTVYEANWLQIQENAVDTAHTYYLHGHAMHLKGLPGGEYYYRPIERFDFEPFEWGIQVRRIYAGQRWEEEVGNPLIFPNMLRVGTRFGDGMHWRMPVDDTRTRVFLADLKPTPDGSTVEEPEDLPVHYRPFDGPPHGEYELTSFPSQDKMAYETAGAIADRPAEHLGASDKGVILFRRMLREQIERVQRGEEPMALVRDPARNAIIRIPTSQGALRAAMAQQVAP